MLAPRCSEPCTVLQAGPVGSRIAREARLRVDRAGPPLLRFLFLWAATGSISDASKKGAKRHRLLSQGSEAMKLQFLVALALGTSWAR